MANSNIDLEQFIKTQNSVDNNKIIDKNEESIIVDSILSSIELNKNEKEDEKEEIQLSTKIKCEEENNENCNVKPIIKKISYASVVKGDVKKINNNKICSNKIPKKSLEQLNSKSSFGSINKEKNPKSVICKNEYPSLLESKNIDTKLKKKLKENIGSGGYIEKKLIGKNSSNDEKEFMEQESKIQTQSQNQSQNQNQNQNQIQNQSISHSQSQPKSKLQSESESQSQLQTQKKVQSHSKCINNDTESKQLFANEYQQFLIAYIISIKLLDDNNWKNSSWSKSTEISLHLINLWESLFLKNINYNLYISENEYNKWYSDFEDYRKESREFTMFLSNSNYWINFNNNFNSVNLKSYNYGAIKDYYYYYINNNVNNNNPINNSNPFIYSESPRNELSTFVKNPYSFPVSVNYLGPSNSYDNLLTFKSDFNPYNFSKNYQKKRNYNNCNNNNNNNNNTNKVIYKKNNKLKDYQPSLEFNNKIYPNKKVYQDYNNTIHFNKIIKKNAYYFHYNT